MPGLNNHQCAWFTITSVWQLITFFCSEFPSSSCFRSTAMCLGFENRTAAPPPAPDQLPAPRNRPVGSSPAHRCPSTEESWPNEKISTALYHMHRRDPITTDVPRGRAAESHISYQITPDFSLTALCTHPGLLSPRKGIFLSLSCGTAVIFRIQEMSASLRRQLPKFEVYPLRPVLARTESTACLLDVLCLL